MARNLQTFPVMKNGKFIGHADAEQIAKHPSLELFDEAKAAAIKAQAEVDAETVKADAEKTKVETAKKAGGADAAAVKKAPAAK